MSRLTLGVGFIFYVLLNIQDVSAMSDEQKAAIHAHFESVGKDCINDNPVTSEDIADLRGRKVPSGANVPCFMACVMKQIGLMDDSGMVQKETVLDMAKKVFEDEEEIKNIEEYLHSCSHINDEQVGDGAKGCERAMLSYKCMMDNASKFGFDF